MKKVQGSGASKANSAPRGGGASTSRVKTFVQAKRNANPRSMFNPKSTDEDQLSDQLLKTVRKSGVLNLSNRNLTKVPAKVWKIHEMDDKQQATSSVSLDNPSEEKWWEFVDLSKLIIANNCIKQIPSEIKLLPSLQTLDAHDNQIDSVAVEVGELKELSKLDLSHNRLKNLPVELYNLQRLGILKLNHNQLEVISKELGQLSILKELDISFNNIVNLPDDIGFLSFLSTLNVSNNKLVEIPHDIGGLTGLREFDASNNDLTSLPSSFCELIHLQILRLQNNNIVNIPASIGCPNLKEVYLENNFITAFSSGAFANSKVELIDCRNNKIQNLEVNREDLEFLDRFFLENNDISILPDDVALIPTLKHLSLEGNPMRGIRVDILKRGTQALLKHLRNRLNPLAEKEASDAGNTSATSAGGSGGNPRHSATMEELELDPYKLKNTKTLSLVSRQIKSIEDHVFISTADAKVNKIDLSKNRLSQLPSTFENMSDLVNELILDFNQFTILPPCIGKFVNLQFLSFQNNQLEELPAEFAGLVKLREINFGYNRFRLIPSCLFSLPSLEILIATNNKITGLDVTNLGKLQRLAVLDLSNNDISVVPPELGLLTQIRSLNIEGNAFRVPGYTVLSKGTDAVMDFLRNRIQK